MTRNVSRKTYIFRVFSLSFAFCVLFALTAFEQVSEAGRLLWKSSPALERSTGSVQSKGLQHSPTLVDVNSKLDAAGGSRHPSLAPAPAVNFAPAVPYPTGGVGALSLAVGDVNGDGKIDVVVANWGGSCGGQCLEGSVGVLIGNGEGTFQPAVAYGSGADFAWAVALNDLNKDGKLDIMVTACVDPVCGEGGTAGVLLGNGDGTFQTAVVYSAGPPAIGLAPAWSAIADVNGDLKPDLLVSNVGGVGLLLGNGDGTFQPAVSVAAGPIAVADLNGDHKPDLVCGNGDVKVLLGNGDGTFQSAVAYDSDGGAASVSISDLNGDGKPDLLAGNGSVAVLLGNGDGTFQAAVTYSFGVSVSPIVAADVNADGAPDVIGVDSVHKAVRVVLGNGDGTFQPAEKFGSGGIMPRGAASADVNGDQKPDLLVANYNGVLGVLINKKVGTKTAITTSVSPSHAGQPVTFTATVTPKYGGVPDGEVMKFYDGKTLLSSVPLAGGTAAYTTSSLSVSTHTIKAIYVGDGIFTSSTAKLTQVVEP